MSFLKKNILKNLSIINYLLIFSFLIYSTYIIIHQYDGHHVGLIYSNAIDLINGKLPYQEIFIQYGFLTTLIHSIILLVFDNKVFFLSFFNIIFYLLGVLFIGNCINILTNKNYSLIASCILLFNHPIPWLPWSNYLAFFFISISLFILLKKKGFFLTGLLLSLAVLCRQDFFIPIVISAITFFIFYFFDRYKVNYKILIYLISGFIVPIIIFFIYLILLGVFDQWLKYIIFPKYYLGFYNTTLFDLIIKYIFFFTSDSFFNFIYAPQYFFISIVLIFNSILILLKIFNKIVIPNNLFFIILFSIFLSSVSLNIELFRLYTSITFGIIPLFYFINKIHDKKLKYNLGLLILLPSIFSFIFYPFGNNDQFKRLIFNNQKTVINNNQFNFFKWPHTRVSTINFISSLKQACDVKYLDNLTFDSLLSTVNSYERVRLMPYQKASAKNSEFHTFVDTIKNPELNFIELINNEIQNENIILLINDNNDIYSNSKIKFTSSYKKIEINQSDIVGKPKILRVYIPNKC